ncbi:MAG: hypothetical protein C0501_12765 [Isosphaera sp.]|nr:hypothetical protein [Isosphaera sp.]
MTATATTRVEIDDAIRANPGMLRAADEATAHVLKLVGNLTPIGVIRWRVAPHDPEFIELRMIETPELGGAVATHTFPARYLNDPVSRDTAARRPFGDLLEKRSAANMARIDQLIRGMDFEALQAAYDAIRNRAQTGTTPQE